MNQSKEATQETDIRMGFLLDGRGYNGWNRAKSVERLCEHHLTLLKPDNSSNAEHQGNR